MIIALVKYSRLKYEDSRRSNVKDFDIRISNRKSSQTCVFAFHFLVYQSEILVTSSPDQRRRFFLKTRKRISMTPTEIIVLTNDIFFPSRLISISRSICLFLIRFGHAFFFFSLSLYASTWSYCNHLRLFLFYLTQPCVTFSNEVNHCIQLRVFFSLSPVSVNDQYKSQIDDGDFVESFVCLIYFICADFVMLAFARRMNTHSHLTKVSTTNTNSSGSTDEHIPLGIHPEKLLLLNANPGQEPTTPSPSLNTPKTCSKKSEFFYEIPNTIQSNSALTGKCKKKILTECFQLF